MMRQFYSVRDGVSFYGTAQGGNVEITVDGVLVVVPTTAGQTPEQVAQAVAAAIVADPTLSAAGVAAFADGNRVVTTGTIDSVIVNDAGLSTVPITEVPSLNPAAIAGLVGVIFALGAIALRRRRE